METAPLRRLATFKNSNVDKKSYEDQNAVKLCNYTDVYYNDRIRGGMDFMDATASAAEIAQFTLQKGDVIITKDSETADDIGIPALVDEDLPGVVCGYHLTMLKAGPKLSPEFLFYVLKSQAAAHHFATDAKGVTRMALGQNGIATLPVPVLPIDQQRAIASFLDKETARIDALIDLSERWMTCLADRDQSLVEEAARGALVGHAPARCGEPILNETDPAGTPLGKLLTHKKTTVADAEFEHLSLSVSHGLIPNPNEHARRQGEELAKYSRVEPGDVVINPMWCFKGAVAASTIKGAVSPDYRVYTPRDGVHPEFMAALLKTRPFRSAFVALARGETTFDRRISRRDLESIRVVVPSFKDQKAAMAIVATETEKIATLSEKIGEFKMKLQERRQALITKAVTGQLPIPMQEAIHA